MRALARWSDPGSERAFASWLATTRVAALAASLLIVLVVARGARAQVVARITDVAGRVEVFADEKFEENGVGRDFEVKDGRSITTQEGATAELRLADGSAMEVGPGSTVRLGPGRKFGVSAFLIYGRVRCKVRPGEGVFRVATPRGEVVAGATEFDVTDAPARAADTPAQQNGVSVMTWSGGLPNAALLTVAVTAGVIELHDSRPIARAGLVAAVNAQEVLVATGDEAPRIVKTTGGASPIEVPAFDAEHVHRVQRMVSALALAPDPWNVESDRFDGFVGLDGSPSAAVYTADGRLWATEAMNNEIRRVDFAAHGVVTGFNTSKAVYAYPGWKREAVLEEPKDCLPCQGDGAGTAGRSSRRRSNRPRPKASSEASS